MDSQELKQATLEYAVRLGDDSLVLGHRLSEWTSNGPFLEEDIALGNVALDYIGRARFYYSYAAQLKNELEKSEGATEDDFAYLRDERQFQNHLIHELPKGDFAFTIARQFFVDIFNQGCLNQLAKSTDEHLASIAQKAIKETAYHVRRSKDWVLRLGDGTEESHERMQNAVNELWGYTHELFEQDELETNLVEQGVAAKTTDMRPAWEASIKEVFDEATLTVPDSEWAVRGGREGYHTENLGHLLTELQHVPSLVSWLSVVEGWPVKQTEQAMTMQLIPLIPEERRARQKRRTDSACPELWDCLEDVKDPEIPALSLWDMGILQDVVIERNETDSENNRVVVTITPTYSGCPAMDVIKEDIEVAVLKSGYEEVAVVNKLSPAWTTDWMTPEAQKRLREFGIAAPDDMTGGRCRVHEMESLDDLHVKCPQCESKNTKLLSEFGSTACKALMQCNDCAETFDYFKRI